MVLRLTCIAIAYGLGLGAQTPPPDPAPAPAPPTSASSPDPKPKKTSKPKSRLKLLQQMRVDLDMASSRATVDDNGRKRLDRCHETLINALEQQQRYKSVNAGKVNGCLEDVDKLLDAGAFAESDREKLRQDREQLGESVGKPNRFRLPKPL